MAEVSQQQWDALCIDDNPFISHAFLDALESCRCIHEENGWQPLHLTLWHGDSLVGAMPLYLKGHSHGEFVFDWGWADAYERAGGRYYPKLLCASPLSPVPGPRLLSGTNPDIKPVLINAAVSLARNNRISSLHLNFTEPEDDAALRQTDLLERIDWQYHWHNNGYQQFDDFLSCLSSKKRKNIRQERQKLKKTGWQFDWIHGDHATPEHWELMYRFYQQTFAEKGNWALLTQEFFQRLGEHLGARCILVLAKQDGQYLAGALQLRSSTRLYGRYWGSLVDSPGLHFETCYYQGIEYAITHGLKVFEPGAQGQHKIARGFLPVQTRSFHYLTDPALRNVVARHLEMETCQRQQQGEILTAHSPFKKTNQ